MTISYFNYPTSSITVHKDPRCSHIRSHRKEGQRLVSMNLDSLSRELGRFQFKEYRFGSIAALNDMWVEVECGDPEFDLAVTRLLHRILGKRYKPFREASVYVCRCAK